MPEEPPRVANRGRADRIPLVVDVDGAVNDRLRELLPATVAEAKRGRGRSGQT